MNEIDNQKQNRYPLLVNSVGVSVAFTINFPELIALLSYNETIGLGNFETVYAGLTWMQVFNEILFTYISILVLFYVNERLFRFNSVNSNINGKKIFFSFIIAWFVNSILCYSFVFLNKNFGIATIEAMIHVYSHPLRNFLIAGIVTTSGYLVHQSKISKKVILENQQLKTENIKNQFEALKNQLNPHMLFNSLNTLYSLIRESPEKAQEYLTQLSKVIRYTLQNEEDRESNAISLKEECEYVKSYIYLLKTRYEKNLTFNLNINEKLYNKKLPRMAIQLLVENSVKHNEISNKYPLIVNIRTIGDDLLEVSNKLRLRRGTVDSTGIGLDNLNKRCQLLFGKNIEICESDGYFRVIIPLA